MTRFQSFPPKLVIVPAALYVFERPVRITFWLGPAVGDEGRCRETDDREEGGVGAAWEG